MNPNSNPYVSPYRPVSASFTTLRRFAHHAGAVVGVVFGVIFAVVFSAIWILIARRKRNEMQQIASDPGLASTRERSWRTPLEDGEDGGDAYHRPMAEQYPGILSALESSDNHPESGGSDADGLTSGALRRGSSLGQRPHMTGFGQAAETIAMAIPVGSLYPANKRTLSLPSINFVTHSSREHEPDFVQGSNWTSPPTHLSTSGHSSGHGQEDAYGGGSTVSLNTYAPLASSHGHGATSSSSATSMNSPRSSGSKPLLSTPSSHGQRASGSKVHSLTSPPTSFAFKGSDDSDTRSLKGFIGLLRRDRSPASKIEPPPRRRHSLESRMPFSSSPYTSSPSSLLGPRPAGGIDTVLRKPSLSMGLYGGQPSSSPWPGSGPLTLPSQPSAMTLGLPVSEGLLNPRLESLASLEDHEDYSRPIGGVGVCFSSFSGLRGGC